jgi:hypothetical protein
VIKIKDSIIMRNTPQAIPKAKRRVFSPFSADAFISHIPSHNRKTLTFHHPYSPPKIIKEAAVSLPPAAIFAAFTSAVPDL